MVKATRRRSGAVGGPGGVSAGGDGGYQRALQVYPGRADARHSGTGEASAGQLWISEVAFRMWALNNNFEMKLNTSFVINMAARIQNDYFLVKKIDLT